MGFNKRYLDRNMILKNLSKMDSLLNSDALILDSWSSNFIGDLNPNHRKHRVIIMDETKFSSNPHDWINHRFFPNMFSLSELLISLSTEPTWVDIQATLDILKPNIPEESMGKFEEIKKLCIESIINHYDSLV
jgi:hypothetical protein